MPGAQLRDADVLLDVGCGDGLPGFGALARTPSPARVVLADVSPDLLQRCAEVAQGLGVSERCAVVHDGLPDLAAVAAASVDVAVLRSVLIYVEDERAAFAALRRVLRPGGRLSLFEPITAFGHPAPPGVLRGFDVTGLEDPAARVAADQGGQSRAVLGFDERDLLPQAEEAGLVDLHLELEATAASTHPWAGSDLDAALEPAEQRRLVERFRTRLNGGEPPRSAEAVAYLTARSPARPDPAAGSTAKERRTTTRSRTSPA